ncbi:MAG TPA: pentapeptide repeat-containing protein [Pyrinomonadaceae bacterium]|jgi:uncharacterized protein YjbI with pentapeptide repeats|nr:pentapeptide repeat-containing protein [Pyrinomonadaceae bacterium]
MGALYSFLLASGTFALSLWIYDFIHPPKEVLLKDIKSDILAQAVFCFPVFVWFFIRFSKRNFRYQKIFNGAVFVYIFISLIYFLPYLLMGSFYMELVPVYYLSFLVLCFFFFVLWKAPKRILFRWEKKLEPKDYLSIENSLRTAFLQLVGGVVVIVGFYFAWQNVNVAQENLKMSFKQNEVERFDKAIVMLKDENPEIRILAIRTLERIGLSSDETRSDVAPMFVDYIRKWTESLAKSEPAPRTKITVIPRDIDAAFEASYDLFLQRDHSPYVVRNGRLDLSTESVRLRAEARNLLNFEGIDLSYLQFQGLRLTGSFANARFNGSKAWSVNLDSSDLMEAEFKDVDFGRGALFYDARLLRAKFNGAILLEARFYKADLRDADFNGADLTGASFNGANLERADFTLARNLSAEGFLKAENVEKAFLPDQLRIEIQQLRENKPD